MRKMRNKMVSIAATAALATAALSPASHAAAPDEAAKRAVIAAAGEVQGDSAVSSGAAGGSVSGSPGADGVQPQEAKVSKQQADEKARQLLSIPDDYTLQSTSFNTGIVGAAARSSWNLSYVRTVNGKQTGSIDVGIDAEDGGLLRYYVYVDDPSHKPSYPPKVDREAAEEAAMRFISQVGAKYADRIKLDPDFGRQLLPPLDGAVQHTLRFNRVVNDIPYPEQYIDVRMDGDGRITQYQVQWNDAVEFGEEAPGLTLEQAEERMRAEASAYLNYLIPFESKERKPALAYSLDPFMLDAATGERWDGDGQRPATVSAEPVTAEPLAEPPASGRGLNAEQAAELVAGQFKLPEGAVVTGSSYSENSDAVGRSTAEWHLNWSVRNAEGRDENVAWANVDASTGIIRSYSGYGLSDGRVVQDDAQAIGYDAAKAEAVETVKRLLPHLTNQLYVQETNKSVYEGKTAAAINEYYFSFVRKVHGATVEYDNVGVAVSAATGEVTRFNAYLEPVDYPAGKPETISSEQAVDAWMDYYKLELVYVTPYVWNGDAIPLEKYRLMVAAGEIRPDQSNQSEPAKLVYRLAAKPIDGNVYLDAVTGEWRDRGTGELSGLVRAEATDIDGHWAQRELELMVAYRALDLTDGQVRPNAVITRGELIKMLVLAMNSGRPPIAYAKREAAAGSFADVAADSSFFVYVESALQANLIDRGDGSFRPDEKVDREEMAELIVRALGYNPLAQYDELFNISFADADMVERKGQAAIAVGLGIMSLQDGSFAPDREVTRAEASAAFFRFLQKRAELREAPLRM